MITQEQKEQIGKANMDITNFVYKLQREKTELETENAILTKYKEDYEKVSDSFYKLQAIISLCEEMIELKKDDNSELANGIKLLAKNILKLGK